MRKLVLFVLIVGLIVIGVLLASKLLPGFDKWASSSVLAPVAGFFGGIVKAVTSHPFWIAFDVWITMAVTFVGTLLLVYVVWPRAKSAVKPVIQSPVTLQREIPPSPPREVAAAPVEKEVVAEAE